jgi:hypothetical protein
MLNGIVAVKLVLVEADIGWTRKSNFRVTILILVQVPNLSVDELLTLVPFTSIGVKSQMLY